MSGGHRAARAHILGRVRAALPITGEHDRFAAPEDGTGMVARLEEMRHGDRVLCLDWTDGPVPSEEAGVRFPLLESRAALRVRYEPRGDRASLQDLIAEDTVTLIDALLGDGDYDTGTTGIRTIDADPLDTDVETIEGDDGGPWVQLTITFTVLLHEEGLRT